MTADAKFHFEVALGIDDEGRYAVDGRLIWNDLSSQPDLRTN
jgi:hypothetical protein